ncbi:DUF4864 domain-containing protein [Rhodobacteraceae bacterium D3-12]|nr:DUF4864 domain-containing protein [Rhodobacteraceae bacterium D3-12]
MARYLIALVMVFATMGGGSARAQGGGIEATVSGQIEAFRAGDFAAAFGYASPGIQGIFQTLENFGMMVRQGYGVLLNPADMQFLNAREEGGKLWQRVLYRDVHGEIHIFDYEMIKGPEGWKIGAVNRVEMPKPSA